MLKFNKDLQEFYFDLNKISILDYTKSNNQNNSLNIAKNHLFTKSGENKNYYIFKNFIDKNISLKIKDYFCDNNIKNKFIDGKNGSHRLFFYLNSPFYYPKFLKSLIKNLMSFKNMIYVHHDFYQNYCMINNLNPNDYETVADNQLLHSWQSAYWYKNNCKFEKHIDYYGELACFLILSEKNVDYEQGGIQITYNDGTKKQLDDEYNYGDLVFLDQSKVYHEVKEIKHNDNQIGRLQLYIPTIPPNYMNDILFYEGYNNRPFFTSKNINFIDRLNAKLISYFKKHKIHYSRTNPNLSDYNI